MTREERRAEYERWMQLISPGKGLRARFDRGVWAAIGQREPWKWSWPRAVLVPLSAVAVGVALAATGVTDWTVAAGIGGAYTAMVSRARTLHRRFMSGG
jgi:hypothetical protein